MTLPSSTLAMTLKGNRERSAHVNGTILGVVRAPIRVLGRNPFIAVMGFWPYLWH